MFTRTPFLPLDCPTIEICVSIDDADFTFDLFHRRFEQWRGGVRLDRPGIVDLL